MRGDLADPATAARACAGADVVFHEGAVPSVPRSVAEPVATNRANMNGTLNVLVVSRETAKVRRIAVRADEAVGHRLDPGDLGKGAADRAVGRPGRPEIHRTRAALPPVQHVEAHVRRDPVEPGAERRATFEAIEVPPCP